MNAVAGLCAGLMLVTYLVVEGRLRVGSEARSLDAGVDDRGSTRRLAAAYAISILVFIGATILGLFGLLSFAYAVAWSGVVVMAFGIALRFWSARVLGASYTRTLRTSEGQRIVRAGPYRFVRHPGYSGSLLIWSGAALATGDWIGVLVIVPLMVWAYLRRIEAEEAMLTARFGAEYAGYARQVRRLVPFVL